jgi:hypothetical protein
MAVERLDTTTEAIITLAREAAAVAAAVCAVA